MATINTFTDFSAEQKALERRRRMAEMLGQQSMQPIEVQQNAPISWTQQLAKALQGYQAGREERDVGEREKALTTRARTEAAEFFTGMPQAKTEDLQAAMPFQNDDEGNAMPSAMKTTQPTKQEMLAFAMKGAASGNPMVSPVASALMAQYMKPEEGFTLGEGQQRFDAGGHPIAAGGPRTFAPQAPQKPMDKWSEPYQLNGVMVQRNEADGQVRTAVTREPTTRVINNNPAPITPVTIQDPKDPNKTIIVDGRSGRLIGPGPKSTDVGKMETKRQFNMQGIGQTIEEAENLLSGAGGKPLPTGSGLGTVYDKAAGFFGASPEGAAEAQRIAAVGAALVSKMPRMEGPQSDKDVQLYKESAGLVGDSTIPVARRKAALETVKQLWSKYERLNPGTFANTDGGGMPSQSEIDAEMKRRGL